MTYDTAHDGPNSGASPNKRNAFSSGASLVWRRQRILWWIFAVNLVFAFWAGRGVRERLAGVLDHSLAADRLVHGFSLGAYQELANLPQQPFSGGANQEFGAAFFLFMLLITGGILETYRRDESLTTGEFFWASGRFFWRFLRMLIFELLALIPAAIIAGIFFAFGGHVYAKSISDAPGLLIDLIGLVIVLFLVCLIRLWFDMAEVITVVENEPKSRRSVGAAWRLLWHNFSSLVWLYFRIGILAEVVFFGGLWLWLWFGPPEAITLSFLVGQILILFWLGCRLWQRSAETMWYQGYQRVVASEPVPEPVPVWNPSAGAWPPREPMPIPSPEIGPATEPEES
jgi:hypothetical protein